MKKILFITWDSPSANYLEGLFLPIFNEISKYTDYKFTILQFTWASPKEKERVALLCNSKGVPIEFINVYRKPHVALGSLWTILKNIVKVRRFVKVNDFDIVMPRSLMPALCCLFLNLDKRKLLYDADGLPLLERLEFSNASKKSNVHKLLSWVECKTVAKANAVITRSKFAIEYLLKTYRINNNKKFYVVNNGRSENIFVFNAEKRELVRDSLGLNSSSKLVVYCGSLDGNKYLFDEMLEIFRIFKKDNSNAHFLVITNNVAFALEKIDTTIKDDVTVKCIPPHEVPEHLSAADIALAIIKPTESMKAASAVKLGEYFLMGIPIIATAGVGNSKELLSQSEDCLIFDLQNDNRYVTASRFISSTSKVNSAVQREIGLEHYSMKAAALSYIKAFNQL